MMIEEQKSVSRRDFLKMAGIAGAVIGAGAGLGGLAAACGEGATTTTVGATTTTAGATATTAAATTTSAAATTTSAGVEMGREVKIGYARPATGPMAAYGMPDEYIMARVKEAYGDGLIAGDGKKHPIKMIATDTQSDTNRASQVAGDMIHNDKCDLIMAAGTADTVSPVADQAEAAGVPCLSTDCPFENFVGGRSHGDMTATFKWTYNAGWTVADLSVAWVDYWNQISSNKKMGVVLGNNAMGTIWQGLWGKLLPANGFEPTFGDLYNPGTEDYTDIIAQVKRAGCELALGLFTPPDMTNFWKQSIQQGWVPKAFVVGIALNFPSGAVALGDLCINLGGGGSWSRAFPFNAPLLGGETCAEFAAGFEEATGEQWNSSLQHLMLWEWAADIVQRTTNLDDKESLLAAVKTTKMDTILGPLDFTEPITTDKLGSSHNHENNYKMPIVAVQWRKSTGRFPYEPVIVTNASAPNVPTESTVQAIVQS